MSTSERAPGLQWKKRRNGPPAAFWVARADLRKAGYRPKTVRLHYEPGDPALAARCHVLQAEMLSWAIDQGRGRPQLYDGTFASMVSLYETHPDSPYRQLRHVTQNSYAKALRAFIRYKGERRIDAVTGIDVRRWYSEFAESRSRAWAHYIVAVVKCVLAFGTALRIDECRLLREELSAVRFGVGERRRVQLTYAHVTAFRKAAHELGFAWMARCVTLQFDFAMRRRDVIGEYTPDGQWRDGLTWSHVDASGIVRKLISKTSKTSGLVAVHAIADYPDVATELAHTPMDRRIGPLVVDPRTGRAPTDARCRAVFRTIARAAGIPDEVCQMDARAGANTEAYEAGATEEEAMALATHNERSTNRGYLRDLSEQSRRAAAKRVERRSNSASNHSNPRKSDQ